MIIKNGLVFTEEGTFVKKDIYIEGSQIVSSQKEVTDQMVMDARGKRILPGLVDVHSHGAAGCDFGDANVSHLKKTLAYQVEHGVTSYCPTSMTLSLELLEGILVTATQVEETPKLASVAGIHMEGPFIALEKKGAQNAAYISKPSATFFRACNEVANGMIKLITIAPEIDGALEFIEEVSDEVTISIGHTNADYDAAKKAIEAGVHHVTHLFNAMPPLHHRKPGVIGAAAENPECMVEVISDGFHIHPAMIRNTFNLFGGDRVILISDSMSATGLSSGEFELGGQKVFVRDGKALLEDGTIAASTTNVYDCMCKAISFGVSKEDAIFAATRNPAKSIGVYNQVGSITAGKKADLLIVGKDFSLEHVCHLGQFIS